MILLKKIACWIILTSSDLFDNNCFKKTTFRSTIRVSNCLGPDQDAYFVRLDLGREKSYSAT